MAYNKDRIFEAWKLATQTGYVDETVLRPEIARAWTRCINMGIDPWSLNFPPQMPEKLEELQKKYSAIIEACTPVLKYMSALYNCNASIANSESFVFQLITPIQKYPRTLGTYVLEDVCGSGNITIAVNEKRPVRVDGYEHFRAISHSYSGVAAPIFNLQGEDFYIMANSPFIMLPENALDVCIKGAELVKKLCASRREIFMHLSSASFFDPVIQSSTRAVIVTDEAGNILTCNTPAKDILPGWEKASYGEDNIAAHLKNKADVNFLMREQNLDKPRTIEFKLAGRGNTAAMKLIRILPVELVTGAVHKILVLDSESAQANAKKASDTLAHSSIPNYIGQSEAWKKIDNTVHRVAPFNSNVMIMGETGTGKEVVAQALHRLSGRRGEFVAINCGGLTRELLSSELFGYESGAFTGAKSGGAMGKFEYANGGTLFLDEIGDMPLDMQVSLLRVIQEQCVTRIGSNKSIPIDVRIVAATNQNVKQMIANGKFRADLWYRLSVIEIYLPSLKDRVGDVPLLAQYFNETLSKKLDMNSFPISAEVQQFLDSYSWPGNVRQLKNIMEKALIIAGGEPLKIEHFPEEIGEVSDRTESAAEPVKKAALASVNAEVPEEGQNISAKELRTRKEREKIMRILEEECGNISRSAKRLNISRNTLYRKMEKLSIQIKVQASD